MYTTSLKACKSIDVTFLSFKGFIKSCGNSPYTDEKCFMVQVNWADKSLGWFKENRGPH